MAFQIVQILYWLALATWFGGVLFIALSAPVIFRAVRESNPVLPDVLSVNLEGQHGTLLAGSIVGHLLSRLVQIELLCGGMILVLLIAQIFVIDISGSNRFAFVLRAALVLAAVVLVIYDWRVLWPKIWKLRQQYVEHADEPDVANPAKDQFDHLHRQSVSLLSIVLFLLLGVILFSGNITPKRAALPIDTQTSETHAPTSSVEET